MKKNKKGFTLVEILAVIVVLIIISIIAINKVSQVMRTNNENATKANAVTFIKAIEENASLNRVTGNFNDGTYSVSQIINMGLKVNGTKPVDGSVLIMDGKVLFSCLEYEKFTFQGNKSSSEIVKDKCGELGSLDGEYEYTGTEKTFTALIDGTYKLEVWGAEGGKAGTATDFVPGGYGSYSVASIHLNKGEKLYINVGGRGTDGQSNVEYAEGGYNGGGRGARGGREGRYSGSGGGATSIATESGLISTFGNKINKLLIVAGGGAGSWSYPDNHNFRTTQVGHAGGYTSTAGISTHATAASASQTSGYSFGTANAENTGESPGAGGGFYGGNSASFSASGGSGYIGNYKLFNRKMYCYNCAASNIFSLETESVACVQEEPTEKCAKNGNGYAKITYTTEENNDTNKYLYSVGNEFNSVTGGWIAGADQSNGRAEKLKDSMYIYTTQQGTSESHVITANAVDITGYAKIHVIYQIVSTYSTGDYGKLQVFTNNGVWVNNVGEGIYHAVVDLPSVASTKINLRDWDVNIKILQVYLSKK